MFSFVFSPLHNEFSILQWITSAILLYTSCVILFSNLINKPIKILFSVLLFFLSIDEMGMIHECLKYVLIKNSIKVTSLMPIYLITALLIFVLTKNKINFSSTKSKVLLLASFTFFGLSALLDSLGNHPAEIYLILEEIFEVLCVLLFLFFVHTQKIIFEPKKFIIVFLLQIVLYFIFLYGLNSIRTNTCTPIQKFYLEQIFINQKYN